MSDTVVVDGVTYSWCTEDDEHNGSLSFSHRGSYLVYAKITGDDGSTITFAIPRRYRSRPGWWKAGPSLTAGVERAVREKKARLDHEAALRVLDGPDRTIHDELAAATRAIETMSERNAYLLMDAMLAIGCSGADRLAVDDWVASHANQLQALRLQGLLDAPAHDYARYRRRSSFEFLIEACRRMNVELMLDTTVFDAELKDRTYEVRPWGIPASHWWWEQGTPPDDED
ncbi:MAG TPA: hypothetical protein VFQ53_04940 [Kofleriaceae bacterium]|nr:hypothetical protein [Kofleriaceae bacterium]